MSNYSKRPQNQQRIYTDPVKKWIIENISSMSYKAMAVELGCTVFGLKRRISIWRGEGLDIEKKTPREVCAIGTERERSHNGRREVFVKTEVGWRVKNPTPRKPREKVEKVKKVKSVKVKPPKPRNITPSKRQPKQVRTYKTITRDTSNQKMVKVDRRTWIYGDKSKSDQEIIDNYYSRRM